MITDAKDYVTRQGERIVEKYRNKTIKELIAQQFDSIPEQINVIADYLPQIFQDEDEKEYVDALFDAVRTSCRMGIYQFAYVQYHMLFMTSIYFLLLKISYIHKDEFEKALYYILKDKKSDFYSDKNTRAGKLHFGSFASISESEVFFLLKVVGIDDSSFVGDLKELVKERNKYVHANGALMIKSHDMFVEKIKIYNDSIKRVFENIRGNIADWYKNLLTSKDFYDPEIRAYADPLEQIKEEFIKQYAISHCELNWLRKIKLSDFDGYEASGDIKELHYMLIQYYKELGSE